MEECLPLVVFVSMMKKYKVKKYSPVLMYYTASSLKIFIGSLVHTICQTNNMWLTQRTTGKEDEVSGRIYFSGNEVAQSWDGRDPQLRARKQKRLMKFVKMRVFFVGGGVCFVFPK